MSTVTFSRGVIALLCFGLAVAFSVAAAFRALGLDRDYFEYLLFYTNLEWGNAGRFETGFVLLSLLIKNTFQSFEALLFFVALISLGIKFYLLSQYRFLLFWVLVYVLMLLPLHEMTQLRVAVAIGFGYLALHVSVSANQRWRSIILFLVGVSFHWTILIISPFVLFRNYFMRFSLMRVVSVILLPVIFLQLAMGTLEQWNPMVAHLLSVVDEMEANPFSSRNLVYFVVLGIGLSAARKLSPVAMPWFYISMMGVGIWYGMMAVPVFAHRLLEITTLSYFIWISFLPVWKRRLSMALFLALAIYIFSKAVYFDPLFR